MENIELGTLAASLVALINLVIAIINLIKKNRSDARSSNLEEKALLIKWKRWFWISLSVFILLIALILWQPWVDKTTEIKITNIAEGDSVIIDVMVKGTSKYIPKDHKIWMVIFSHPVNRFYPQNEPADMHVNGNWSSRCYIGIKEDVEKRFDLLAILVDKDIQKNFMEYIKEAKDKEDWSGLEEIPDNAKVYQRITVIRK